MQRTRLTGFRGWLTAGLAASLAVLTAATGPAGGQDRPHGLPFDLSQAPEGFIPPPLHPHDTVLETRQLAYGVYALLSGEPAVDNSGFVVGERGVLVIDAHINGAMAQQIQEAVHRVTNLPILYLVNTNHHGDHTFGNYAFPAETVIIAHRETARHMAEFEAEKELLLPTVEGDASVFAGVSLRLPDLAYDDFVRIDLGSRSVELHHFGPGNTAGDTVVWVPEARVAWTGNLVIGMSIPPIFEGRTDVYLETIARFAAQLHVETIVPGHGPLTGPAALDSYMGYLGELLGAVRTQLAVGRSLEETLAALPLAERYLPPADSPAAGLRPFLSGLHRLNVQQTYRDLASR